jgi:hypothetical protein
MDRTETNPAELMQFRTSIIKLPQDAKDTQTTTILQIRKRNGNVVNFDMERIQIAIGKAFDACQADK